jgi:hypothetical protein
VLPVVIFLFLKGAGRNEFAIPVYYENGIPEEQRFDCSYANGAYYIQWPDSLAVSSPVLVYFSSGELSIPSTEKENIFRRIRSVTETDLAILVFSNGENKLPVDGIRQWDLPDSLFRERLHCWLASDTVNQFSLVDSEGRIRGYYGNSLKEQDRLLVELKILFEETK